MKTKILYEDDQVIVIHKPAGLATQSGKIGQADVVSELKNYLAKKTKKLGNNPYLGVVHRLDQPVEGLLVFAKTPNAAANLSAQLQKGTLNKHYYAICHNADEKQSNGQMEGSLIDYLLKDGNLGRVVDKGTKEAKEARLEYRALPHVKLPKKNLLLFDIAIETGRFHQIRLQMSHAGFPLLGDAKYGTEESVQLSKELGIRNVCLYAYQVAFTHPKTGKFMEFKLELESLLRPC